MDEILALLTKYLADIHNKTISAEGKLEKVKGTKLEQDLKGSLDYLKAVEARLSVCKDIMEGRAFVLYQEEGSKDLIVARPDETTAKLVKKAEEMGARMTEFNDLVPGRQQSLL